MEETKVYHYEPAEVSENLFITLSESSAVIAEVAAITSSMTASATSSMTSSLCSEADVAY